MINRARAAVIALAMAAGCSEKPPATKTYQLTGQILAVHNQSLTIKHDDIPGYMPSMTMTFPAADKSLVAGREKGQLVKATLEVGDTWSRLTKIEVTGTGPIKALPVEIAIAEGMLEPGKALPDAPLVDHNGRARNLSEWRGQPFAVTFTYTRCPIPEFCPRIDRQFAAVQRAIAADPALRGRAKLVTISFDPDHDTPPVMKKHAASLGANDAIWTFMTGARSEVEIFAARFGVAVTRNGETAADIVHNLRTIVVGAGGTIVALHNGTEWTVEQLVSDLRR